MDLQKNSGHVYPNTHRFNYTFINKTGEEINILVERVYSEIVENIVSEFEIHVMYANICRSHRYPQNTMYSTQTYKYSGKFLRKEMLFQFKGLCTILEDSCAYKT